MASSTIKVRNISEALQPRPKVEYYIDKIIRPASLNQFYAEPGTGKSLAFITMGVCFCDPEIDDWLGYEIRQKGKVLFVQEEMGDDGFLEFLEETYRGFYSGKGKKLPFDFTVFEGLNFSSEKSVTRFSKVIEDNEYKLVFADSFAATVSENEDKKEDMQPVLDRARLITELPSKPALIFTHHPTKSNGDYRGSGAIKAALDLLVKMKKSGTDKIEFVMEKNRYKPCINWEAKKVFDKDIHGNDTFILERTDKPSNLAECQKLMIGIIESNPEHGQQELKETYIRMGGKSVDALPVLKMLDDSEITEIVSESRGGQGKKKVRKLTDAYLAECMNNSVANVVKQLVGKSSNGNGYRGNGHKK